MIHNIIMIGAGSCLGGVARYLVSRAIGEAWPGTFPWGTLAVNLAGCFIIGLIYGLLDRGAPLSEGWRLFLTVGFCGGFTTFSTFMNENYHLASGGEWLPAALYTGVSLIGGFLLIWAAYALIK